MIRNLGSFKKDVGGASLENCNALLKENVEPDAHHSALMGLHSRGENSSQCLRKYLE